MALGPIEMLVVSFPGNQFKGEIVPELKRLVESGTIRVIDILFVLKDRDGSVAVVEMNDLDDDNFARFDPVVTDLTGLLGQDDVERFSAALENNSSAALMLFENTWATGFRDAVVNANGRLVFSERIPKRVIDELLAEAAA
jgi:Family of unknown function (DUF6325)